MSDYERAQTLALDAWRMMNKRYDETLDETRQQVEGCERWQYQVDCIDTAIHSVLVEKAQAVGERDELKRRLEEAREVVREFEWIEHMTEEGHMCMACPGCFRNNMDPDHPVHNDDCKLAAVLREGE